MTFVEYFEITNGELVKLGDSSSHPVLVMGPGDENWREEPNPAGERRKK
jgi:hypothetical protein